MSLSGKNKKDRQKKSLLLILLAWVFIGGQGLLAAGSAYNCQNAEQESVASEGIMPWGLVSQSANRVRLVAAQARPDVVGNIAIFLAVANVLGLMALLLAVVSWSRSQHSSGRLTIAAAVIVILVNSMLNLPFA